MKYKVWVEIEQLDDNGDAVPGWLTSSELGILPDSLGTFDTAEEAIKQQAEVAEAYGIDPENSDAVRNVLSNNNLSQTTEDDA